MYMASQLQDPPILDTKVVPDFLHYGKGEFAQDILVVTQPGEMRKKQLKENSLQLLIIIIIHSLPVGVEQHH